MNVVFSEYAFPDQEQGQAILCPDGLSVLCLFNSLYGHIFPAQEKDDVGSQQTKELLFWAGCICM